MCFLRLVFSFFACGGSPLEIIKEYANWLITLNYSKSTQKRNPTYLQEFFVWSAIKEVQEKTTLNKLPTFKIPLFISYGENEPEGWKHQSISYCNFLTKNDYKYKLIPSKGDNHFTLIDTLANENSNICKEIIKLSK